MLKLQKRSDKACHRDLICEFGARFIRNDDGDNFGSYFGSYTPIERGLKSKNFISQKCIGGNFMRGNDCAHSQSAKK
jgi:hypothetical protein